MEDKIKLLEKQLRKLLREVEQLRVENAQLKAENKQLKAENKELRERLGLTSETSHKPPSSDGYKKKPVEVGIPKEEGKKSGGQKGHKGKTLERVSEADKIELHHPSNCECCGRKFEAEEGEVLGSRQVFDLPEPKLEIIEHQIVEIECCGIKQRGDYPLNVTGIVQYGAGVKALVTKLSIDHKMPLEQISQLFADMYGYKLNTGTIEQILKLGYELSEEIEEQIKEQIKEEEVVHFDETGIRVSGKLHWLHVASTENATHLFVHEKRGREAMESAASVLPEFSNIAVHDCWASYFKVTQAQHVLCGAHLLRELKALEDTEWAQDMYDLLLALYRTPRPVASPEQINTYYQQLLTEADQQEPKPEPRPRGKPKQTKGRNLLNRLRKHQKGVLAFAFEPNVPFTNNQAERDLRPAKVKQKVSGCFRTVHGAQVFARLHALILTLRKRQGDLLATLRALFEFNTILLA